MDEQTILEIRGAAELLITSPRANEFYQVMLNAAPLMARHKEIRLSGDTEPLNVLAVMKVANPNQFSKIIDFVEKRREQLGYSPLQQEQIKRFDKTEYMQVFMGQKRLRERRAANIENMQRPDRDKLKGRSRLEFMQRQSAIWKEERDAFIERARANSAPKRLTKEDLSALAEAFWAKIDERLDLAEEVARRGKQVNPSASMAELEAILRHDPYK